MAAYDQLFQGVSPIQVDNKAEELPGKDIKVIRTPGIIGPGGSVQWHALSTANANSRSFDDCKKSAIEAVNKLLTPNPGIISQLQTTGVFFQGASGCLRY